MLMPFFFTGLDHALLVPSPFPKGHGATARDHVGFFVKDRWLGSEGTLMWGLGPSGRISLRASQTLLLHRPCLCAHVTWDGILSALTGAACALGHLPLCLAPGHLGVGGGQGGHAPPGKSLWSLNLLSSTQPLRNGYRERLRQLCAVFWPRLRLL